MEENYLKNKIAFVEPIGGHGGMDYYDISLCNALHINDITPVLFTSDDTVVNEGKLPYKVVKIYKNIYSNKIKLYRGIKYFILLFKTGIIIKKEKIRLTHLHFFHLSFKEVITVIIFKIFNFKQIVTLHDVSTFHGKNNQLIARVILNLIHSIILHNQFSKVKLIDLHPHIENKISIIPHGNYSNYVKIYSKSKAIEKLNLDHNYKYILFFGQIKRVKGLDVLIKALDKVRTKNINCKLIIAGKIWKDDFSNYITLIQKLGLSNHIISHIHYISNQDVEKYFNASDMVVLPYREIFQSGVLLMALSYKKPVIVSDIMGMTDIVSNRKTGLTFKNGDHVELANCIINLFQNESLAEKIAINGYNKIQNEYNWEDIGRDTAKLYKSLLN